MKKRRYSKRLRPAKPGNAYRQMWRLVDGAIADCMKAHPDYFTQRGMNQNTARRSLTKRVTGAVLGYAAEAARGRSAQPMPAAAETGTSPSACPHEVS